MSEQEAYAKRLGWIPQDQFKGNIEDWVDAATFIEKGETELPVLKENLRRQDKKMESQDSVIKDLNSRLNKMQADMKEFGTFHEKVIADTRKQAIKDASRQLKEGVRNDDPAMVAEAEQAIDLLAKQEPAASKAPPEPPKAGEDPAFAPWLKENPWYEKDRIMRAYANDLGPEIARANIGKTSEEVYGLIRDAVKEAFPEKFSNKNDDQSHLIVEDGKALPKKQTGKRKFSDLPKDVQAVVKTQIERGIIKDEARYMELLPADYFDTI